MNIRKIISLLVISIGLIQPFETCAQTDLKNFKIYVKLENAPFDSLYLQDYTEGRNIVIPGKKTKDFTWEITIPDSIVWDSENMILLASPYNPKIISKTMVRFVSKKDEKKVIVVNVGVEGYNNYIYGRYRETIQFTDEQLVCLKVPHARD